MFSETKGKTIPTLVQLHLMLQLDGVRSEEGAQQIKVLSLENNKTEYKFNAVIMKLYLSIVKVEG